jgi:hypothetical protein
MFHVKNIKHAKIRHSVKLSPTKKQIVRWAVDGVGSQSYTMVISLLVVLNSVFCLMQTEHGLWGGALNFYFQKSIIAISKFQTPERYHKVSSMLINYNSGVTCDPHCYLV